MMTAYIESSYELKALIPYASVALHEDLMYSLKNSFRNSLQYLALFQLSTAKSMPDLAKTFIVEYACSNLSRPVEWEDKLFKQLDDQGYTGLYILPDGSVGEIKTTESSVAGQMSKKELF